MKTTMTKHVCAKVGVLLIALSLLSLRASADPVTMSVHNNKVEAVISLPGGIETDLEVAFEKSLGLNTNSIGISAELVSLLDPTLLARLPDALLTSLPAGFPMMITIEPPANQGLAFEGIASVSIHTHNLEYSPNTPLRLFKAPLGGEFRDVTVSTGAGSYRARATTGTFSQFLVVVDLRTVTQVIQTKSARLDTLFNQYQSQIDPALALTLQGQINQANAAITAVDYTEALNQLKQFKMTLENADNSLIPKVWRSSRDITNVAGELIAQADTLSYSLRIAN